MMEVHAIFFLLEGLLGLCLCQATAVYVIDDSPGLGRTFDGIGAISGGGATSKLLPNYPDQQRNEILDYLFKPNVGASLHILKVEIGGDAQSTDGTEASHMHEPWDENYQRGYEWWLMTEAKKRNPDIKLYGLPWAYPGWVGKGSGSPYTFPNITANYLLKWLQGAKQVYNLDIDYIGMWNEHRYSTTAIKILRSVLDSNGFHRVKIVASDGVWRIAGDILQDPKLAAVVDIIGAHYPGTFSSDDARETGKQLWASEDFSTFNDEVGGGCWARILNWNYLNGYLTSTISWNLIASYYEYLPFYRDGLMTAVQPWSGHYSVGTAIWMSAHTTQFTKPGYKYLIHGYGVGRLAMGGTYVSLVDTETKQLTIVIETLTHQHSVCIRPELPPYNVSAQSATFKLAGSYMSITHLNVWYSKLGFDGKAHILFKKLDPVKVQHGMFMLTLGLDEIYTVTTSNAGHKGIHPAPPPSSPFPSPYFDDFNNYREFEEANNFAPQVGSFEIRKSNFSHGGFVNRQTVITPPIHFCKESVVPITIGGNYNWSNIEVEVVFMIPSVNGSDGAFVAARVSRGSCASDNATGIYLSASIKTQNYALSLDPKVKNVIESSALPVQLKTDSWYHMQLVVEDNVAQGYFNGLQLFKQHVHSLTMTGFSGYGALCFGYVDFDSFYVKHIGHTGYSSYMHPTFNKPTYNKSYNDIL